MKNYYKTVNMWVLALVHFVACIAELNYLKKTVPGCSILNLNPTHY